MKRFVLMICGLIAGTASALPAADQPKTAADLKTASFQNGVNGYHGTIDSEIWALAPTTILDGNPNASSDADNDGGESQVLTWFDGISGSDAGQVAPCAVVHSARLLVSAFDQGSTVNLHWMLVPFDESVTWNSFAHMDSFDPKPDAPIEYRGILDSIATRVPGVRFSSHMQETAKVADKLTVVRSMTHTEVDHARGEHSMFTGYGPGPALVYPSAGSVVSHEVGPRGAMPPYVVVPTAGSQFLGSGYLSNAFGPFALGADPARTGFSVRDLNHPAGVIDGPRWFESFPERESGKKYSLETQFMFVRALIIAALLLALQRLQAAPPTVERISPAAGQRGTSFQLKVVGACLQNAIEVMIYDTIIICERLEAKSDNELILHLKAAPDCSVGMHSFRIRSNEGISELHVFRISPLPTVAETESSDDSQDAQLIAVNSTVVGTVEAGDVDSFRITMKKGERLSAEAAAMQSGGSMLDTVLNVMDPDGDWLASVDDTALRRQDPLVSLIALVDGDYIVQIHESSFEGDEASRYALHIGSFPSPTHVFPAGGRAGESVAVTFGGDASGVISQTISLEQKLPGTTTIFVEQGGQSSATGLPFRVSTFGNAMEAEPNNSISDFSIAWNFLHSSLSSTPFCLVPADCLMSGSQSPCRGEIECSHFWPASEWNFRAMCISLSADFRQESSCRRP